MHLYTAATIVGAFSLERRNRRCRTAGAPKANVQSAERQSGKVQSVKVQRGKLERGCVHAGKVHSTPRQRAGAESVKMPSGEMSTGQKCNEWRTKVNRRTGESGKVQSANFKTMSKPKVQTRHPLTPLDS